MKKKVWHSVKMVNWEFVEKALTDRRVKALWALWEL